MRTSIEPVTARALPSENASTRVLGKCGFEMTTILDYPDDGHLWRWELEA